MIIVAGGQLVRRSAVLASGQLLRRSMGLFDAFPAVSAAQAAAADSSAVAAKATADAAEAPRIAKAAADKAVAEATKAEAEAAAALEAFRNAKAAADKAAADAAEAPRIAKAAADKAVAEAAAVAARARVRIGLAVAAGLLLVGLAGDSIYDSWDPVLRWRIRRALVRGPPAVSLPRPTGGEPLPIARPHIATASLPLLILGPTGCGKSTMLGDIARDFTRRGVPTAFVNLRSSTKKADASPPSVAAGSAGAASGGSGGSLALGAAADRFFRAIDYPARPSLYERLSITSLKAAPAELHLQMQNEQLSARFCAAITALFLVCADVSEERRQDSRIKDVDAQPVVIIDELHDLVQNPALRAAGGQFVFEHFAAAMTIKGADERSVRVIAAGSGWELAEWLDQTTANGRKSQFDVAEPSEEHVRAALLKNNYAAHQIDEIISICGLRLRRLNPFLAEPASSVNVAGTLKTVVHDIETNVASLFAGLDSKDRAALAKVMDELCDGKTVLSWRLPAKISSPVNNSVFYLRAGCKVQLQSAAVPRAWKAARAELK